MMKQALILSLALAAGVATAALAQSASEQILNANTDNAMGTVTTHSTETEAMPVGDTNMDGAPDYKVIQTETTVKQTVTPMAPNGVVTTGPAQPETVMQTTGIEPFEVIMPDGTKLEIQSEEWWKDPRLNGYTRFWYDTSVNAYRPVEQAKEGVYEKREKVWCPEEAAASGKC